MSEGRSLPVPSSAWPLTMAFIRLPLVFLGYGLAVYFFRPDGERVGPVAGVIWATVTVSVMNVICLALLVWRFRTEGLSLARAIGFRGDRLFADLLWGSVWSCVLFAALAVGFVLAMFVVGGVNGFKDPDTFFWGGTPDFSFAVPSWLMYVSAFVFPLLNAPVEELQYRGYAQPQLSARSGRAATGIVIASIGFGLQHMGFAMTVASAVAFAVGFLFWGLGAGIIVHRQGRLMQIIVAHLISNLSFGLAPLILSGMN